MKKQLLGVAFSALLLSTAAEARSFDGAFAGANVGYKWESVKLKDTTANLKGTEKPSGMNLSLTGGYGETVGSVYVGGDVRVGYGFGKSSKTFTHNAANINLKTKQKWAAGIGAIVGTEVSNDCLAFFRLGLDYNTYKLSSNAAAPNNFSKTMKSWAVVPGLGLKWKLDKDWYVTGMYEYSHQLSSKKVQGDLKAQNINSHGLKVGVGYQF